MIAIHLFSFQCYSYLHWKKIKFPGLINHRKCQGNLESILISWTKTVVIWYLGNVTGRHISLSYGNFTFYVHFQDKET